VESEWRDQDQHPKQRQFPKLTWAGSLSLDRAGHQMDILFQEQRIIFAFSGILNAWRFRDLAKLGRRWAILDRISTTGAPENYTAAIQFGRLGPVELFPRAPRWLTPWVR